MKKKEKILVVDDDDNVLLLVRANLEIDGYEVTEATNGEEALKSIDKDRPDLVLLDVMMPKVDGWKVLKQIKQSPSLASIPVVMLTAKVQEGNQIKGWESGADEYITKPFNPLSLVQIVKKLLSGENKADREQKRTAQIEKLKVMKKIREEEDK